MPLKSMNWSLANGTNRATNLVDDDDDDDDDDAILNMAITKTLKYKKIT